MYNRALTLPLHLIAGPMAIYRCEFKIYSRGSAHSAVAGAAYVTGTRLSSKVKVGATGKATKRKTVSAVEAAAYRSGKSLADKGTGETFDYTNKHNVVWSGILAPADAPAWARDRGQLWNAVEAKEDTSSRKATAQLFRECLLTLPRGLKPEAQIALVRAFVQDHFVSQGMIADIGIHSPEASDGLRNDHAHVMLTLRSIGPNGFGNKNRDWNDVRFKDKAGQAGLNLAYAAGFLRQRRASWSDYCNAALADAGSTERVDHRSLKDRGIDRVPQPKVGKSRHVIPDERTAAIRDNVVAVKFDNRTRDTAQAVRQGRQPAAGPVALCRQPAAGDFADRTRQLARAVGAARRQYGHYYASDGVAHAEQTARRLHGEALEPVRPVEPTPEAFGHDR